MYNEPFTLDKMQTMEDIHATIDLLYITQCRATKNALLNRLRRLLAQITVPYSMVRSAIPVEQTLELPAASWMQVMQQGPQMVMPPQAPQTMTPQEGTSEMMPQQGPQTMTPQQGTQQQQGMMDIPPYIPQGMRQEMQQGMQMQPGRMQQGTPGPSGARSARGGAQAGGAQAGGSQEAPSQPQPPAQQPRPRVEELKSFTLDELSRYDGKGNNPAYVSVNGMVYDVTDQPGWAAGSHFGLRAGLDQTGAYISCHTGQPMISKLKLVGRLIK